MNYSREHSAKAGDVMRARVALEGARVRLAALPERGHTAAWRSIQTERLLTQAGKVMHAMERMGISPAAKLIPMLPTSAAGLVKQAAKLGLEMAMDRERERGRGGLSL